MTTALAIVASQPTSMTQLDVERACALLAECHVVDDAKAMRDKAAAVGVYMRTRGAGIESQNHAAEIVLRAERRLGELLRESPKAKGGQPYRSTGASGEPVDATLSEQGITKKQSVRWQTLASFPAIRFDEYIETTKLRAEKLTTSGALRRGAMPAHVSAAPRRPTANDIWKIARRVTDVAELRDLRKRLDVLIASLNLPEIVVSADVRGRRAKVPSFIEDTIAKHPHLTPLVIHQELQIATRLTPEVKDLVRETAVADNKTQLLTLSRIKDPKEQMRAASDMVVKCGVVEA